jgi:hypothetical protein
VKLQELKEAMENDLAKLHFASDSIHVNGETIRAGLPFQPTGIGQHLGVDTPSV